MGQTILQKSGDLKLHYTNSKALEKKKCIIFLNLNSKNRDFWRFKMYRGILKYKHTNQALESMLNCKKREIKYKYQSIYWKILQEYL